MTFIRVAFVSGQIGALSWIPQHNNGSGLLVKPGTSDRQCGSACGPQRRGQSDPDLYFVTLII